jgi:hypothetical protein
MEANLARVPLFCCVPIPSLLAVFVLFLAIPSSQSHPLPCHGLPPYSLCWYLYSLPRPLSPFYVGTSCATPLPCFLPSISDFPTASLSRLAASIKHYLPWIHQQMSPRWATIRGEMDGGDSETSKKNVGGNKLLQTLACKHGNKVLQTLACKHMLS